MPKKVFFLLISLLFSVNLSAKEVEDAGAISAKELKTIWKEIKTKQKYYRKRITINGPVTSVSRTNGKWRITIDKFIQIYADGLDMETIKTLKESVVREKREAPSAAIGGGGKGKKKGGRGGSRDRKKDKKNMKKPLQVSVSGVWSRYTLNKVLLTKCEGFTITAVEKKEKK